DWPHRRPRFEVVCTVTDLRTPARIRVVVAVDGEPPAVPSVTGIWPGANWFEREAYDMFGIIFEGHPDLTRILMPDEWEGHPLRKDYSVGKVPVEYKHLSPGHYRPATKKRDDDGRPHGGPKRPHRVRG